MFPFPSPSAYKSAGFLSMQTLCDGRVSCGEGSWDGAGSGCWQLLQVAVAHMGPTRVAVELFALNGTD